MTETLNASAAGDQDFLAPAARISGNGTAGLIPMTDLEHADRLRRMREGTLGSMHSWELVTAVDGPGVRMTIFLAGCGLRCLYCHNPDTFLMRDGEPVELDDLLHRIKRYRKTLNASGGGITISGGEAMMQPHFVAKLLEGTKALGVNTCIDTSGFLGRNVTDEMLDNIDLVLLDVKAGIPELYKKVTTGELQPTIDFGDRLAAKGIETWIRFVLVPGLTDSTENVEAVASIVEKWPNVSRVEVLPFHQMGRDKWKRLGLEYKLDDTEPPNKDQIEAAREIFRSHGLTAY
ncbi:pyruvate formate lyase-activating protein [Arcanobacterium haemolyticum]|nr:pyruvate formate lyase-activating protein [Arcanobacterium haemolyticum]